MTRRHFIIVNMSFTIQVSGAESILKAIFFPPITLVGEHEIALITLESWNSIPNVTTQNNNFYYDSDKQIEIPVGAYEITEIGQFLAEKLEAIHGVRPEKPFLGTKHIDLIGNLKTLKSEIVCRYSIDFTKPRNIGSVLGYKDVVLEPWVKQESNNLVNILQVDALRIDCDLVRGSYNNGNPTHTLHQFFPDVPPGYKILEVPRNLIYLPVVGQVIDSLEIRICDQDGNLVNLRGERTNIRLHLRARNANHL